MIQTTVRVGLALLSSGLAVRALAQAPSTPNAQDVLASTLADLRGVSETIDTSRPENRSDRSALWFSVLTGPTGPIARLDSVQFPARERTSAGTVSTQRLRHRVPKAARRAYERAVGSRDARKAANELESAIKIDPDFAEAHNDLGVIYARLGRNPEAAEELRRTIELVPEESLPYSNLAWVLFEMGLRAEAETNVRRAIQLSPDNAPAHLLMGRLLVERPDTFAEGLGHLQYAARTMPEAAQIAKALRRK
jgi:tetratricopeptide (TPR) repeat protein